MFGSLSPTIQEIFTVFTNVNNVNSFTFQLVQMIKGEITNFLFCILFGIERFVASDCPAALYK